MKTVTIKDIAKAAGVYPSAVSSVLNNKNHTRMSEERREHIRKVAEKLGYHRNKLAATVRTGTNRTVAVVGRFDGDNFSDDFNIVVSGVLREATRLDYGVRIYTDDTDLEPFFDEVVGSQIKLVLSMSVDAEKRSKTAAFCRKHGMRLVFVYETSVDEFPTVTSAEKDGVRDLILYLAALGHRRIAFVCGPHQYSYVRERHAGYLLGMKDAGLVIEDGFIACGEDEKMRERAVEAMLALPEQQRPTAFACIGDSLAMMTQRAAMRQGLRTPEDVSVTGFGNNHLARYAISPLTSLTQPFVQIGETAMRLLAGEKCEFKPDSQNRYLLPMRLLERESTTPPAGKSDMRDNNKNHSPDRRSS